MSDEQEFQVLDPVEVGDLSDVSERPLIPATRKVKVQIKRVNARSNEDKTWRWLNLGLQLVDGIEGGKFKGSYVNSDNLAYYADPDRYSGVAKDKQYLGRLAGLQRATGTIGHRVDDQFIQELQDKLIVCDIIQRFDKYVGENVNIAQNFKVLPPEMSV